MKISKTCKVELIASKDATRPALENPYLDGNQLVATDGKRLVDPNTLKQNFIIFLNNDEVYCTTDSYELANQIVKVTLLNDAVIKQVNHYTGFDISI